MHVSRNMGHVTSASTNYIKEDRGGFSQGGKCFFPLVAVVLLVTSCKWESNQETIIPAVFLKLFSSFIPAVFENQIIGV